MAKHQSKVTPTSRTLFLQYKIQQNTKTRNESSLKEKGKKVWGFLTPHGMTNLHCLPVQ